MMRLSKVAVGISSLLCKPRFSSGVGALESGPAVHISATRLQETEEAGCVAPIKPHTPCTSLCLLLVCAFPHHTSREQFVSRKQQKRGREKEMPYCCERDGRGGTTGDWTPRQRLQCLMNLLVELNRLLVFGR